MQQHSNVVHRCSCVMSYSGSPPMGDILQVCIYSVRALIVANMLLVKLRCMPGASSLHNVGNPHNTHAGAQCQVRTAAVHAGHQQQCSTQERL